MATSLFLKAGKVNRKLLCALIILIAVLGFGLYLGHGYQARSMAKKALTEGQKALAEQKWSSAIAHLKLYLAKYPEDVQVLNQYGQACLAVRPRTSADILSAIGVYRRLIRLTPNDLVPCQKLALLYEETNNYTELSYIAQRWLHSAPNDIRAAYSLAKADIVLRRNEEARALLLPMIRRMEKEQGKYELFTEACLLIGGIDSQSDNREIRLHAVEWFHLAVHYLPNHAEPYLNRAHYRWQTLQENDQPLETKRKLIRADLDQAETKLPVNPKLRLTLCNEWLKFDNRDKIEYHLRVLGTLDSATVLKYYTSETDFLLAKYLVAAELAARNDDLKKGCDLSDQILTTMTEPEYRVLILPLAVKLYAADKQVLQARTYLNEYLDILRMTRQSPELSADVVFLKAMITRAENKPYQLINDLEPMAGRNPNYPGIWALLADAYIQTQQPRRAIRAMEKYLSMVPNDYGRTFQLLQLYTRMAQWEQVLTLSGRLQAYKPNDDTLSLLILRARYEILSHSPQKMKVGELDKIEQGLLVLARKYPENEEIPIVQAQIKIQEKQLGQARTLLTDALGRCKNIMSVELELVRLDQTENNFSEAIKRCRKVCDRYADKLDPWLTLAECQQKNSELMAAQTTLEDSLHHLTALADRCAIEYRLAELEVALGHQSQALARLQKKATGDKDDIQSRMYLLCQPEIYQDQAHAQSLIDEIHAVEGDAGLRWRLFQALLELAQKNWRNSRDRISENLTRCIEADPRWAEPYVLMGQLHERLGDFAAAESCYRRALGNDPTKINVIDHLVAYYEKQDRLSDARDLMNQLPDDEPDRHLKRARFALRIGDSPLALDELREQIKADPKNTEAYVLLAETIYTKTKNSDSAFRTLDEAESRVENKQAILSARCDLLREEGRIEQARQLLNQAVAKNENYDTLLLRAKFLDSLGLSAQAEQDYRRLLACDQNSHAYEQLGQFYADHRRFLEALSAWEIGVQKYPDNKDLKRRWMKGLLLTGRPEDRKKALAVLGEQEQKYPDDTELQYVRGLVFLDENTPASDEKARLLFQRVVENDPSMIDAHMKLIALAMKNKNYPQARDLTLMAQAANPDNIPLLLTRAHIERIMGNYANAVEMTGLVLKENPQNIDALEILVEAAVESGDTHLQADAADRINTVLKTLPDNEQLQILKSQLLRSQNRITEAIANLEAYLASGKGKNDLQVYLVLAELYRLDGKLSPAGAMLQKAAGLAPDSPGVLREELYQLKAKKEYGALVTRIDGYRYKKEVDPYILILASSILSESDAPEPRRTARELLEKIIQRYPQLIDAQLQLAWMNYEQKNYDQAERLYRHILETETTNIQAINNLAWILAMIRQDYPAALTLMNRGVELMPEVPDLRDTRAEILVAAGQLKEARSDYARCITLSPPDSPARARFLLKLAKVTARLGDSRETHDSIQQARSIDLRLNVFTAGERNEMEQIFNLHNN